MPKTPVPAPPSSAFEDATIILTEAEEWATKTWPSFPQIDPLAGPQLWLIDSGGYVPIPIQKTSTVLIGRAASNTVALGLHDSEGAVSRHHARVYFQHRQFGIQDLSSTNGTWWNRQRLMLDDIAPLRHGDVLGFGGLQTVFLVGEAWMQQLQPPEDDGLSTTQIVCSRCGISTPAIFRFCMKCGSRFRLSAPIPPPLVPVGPLQPPIVPLTGPFSLSSTKVVFPPLPIPPTTEPLEHPPTAQLFQPERTTLEQLRSPVLDDQPSSEDHLGFASYSTALRDLVLHPETRTPLTLGIFGRWGTGKTTLMHMLEHDLREKGLVTVWFNAWQYSKEDQLWAAFLQSLLNRMRNDLRPFQRLQFDWSLLRARVDWNALPQVAVLSTWRALVAALPLVAAWPISQLMGETALAVLVQVGGGAASVGLAAWLMLKPVVEAVRQNVKPDFSLLHKDSEYQKHVAFLDSFRDHFQDIVNSLPVKGGKRLAVFVDDLDRCSPDGTLQVLDAIKLFVDIPGCLYVLGVDVDVVHKAIASKFKDDPVAQREYLGKLIQLQFQLPVLTRVKTRNFVERIAPELPDFRCRDVFVEGLSTNPREIKRTISMFSLLWTVVAKRSELRGLLKPVRLAKVVVIRHNFPDLYRLLQETPELLCTLESLYRQESQHLDPAVEWPSLLKSFAKDDSLRSMLLLHPPAVGVEEETGFSALRPEEIVTYFTLTHRMETAIAPLSEGAEVGGLPNFGSRYRVQQLIGQGGMSSVYKALDRKRQEMVAIKVINPVLQSEPRARATGSLLTREKS